MLIDSHCHLDADEFGDEIPSLLAEAQSAGVFGFVLPAVQRSNWSVVKQLAHEQAGVGYMLGIHPCYVHLANPDDIDALRFDVQNAINDPFFLGVGEIGLDFFIPDFDRQKQWFFFVEQLKIARTFDLPVVMHVRRSQDWILKALRQFSGVSGIAHAFNGSDQQADLFVERGICLGFGGAMTYSRALQIRRLAQRLPIESIVLETDAPDISPEWIRDERNDSRQLPRIAQTLAALRGISPAMIAQHTTANAIRQLPKLQGLLPISHCASNDRPTHHQ